MNFYQILENTHWKKSIKLRCTMNLLHYELTDFFKINYVYSQRITPKVNIYLLSLNYYSICNIIRLSVIACSQLNARVCVFACVCSKLLQNVCISSILFLCVLIYSSLLREYVAAAVQFLLQNIKNTCRRSRKLSYEDYLQKWTQSPWNLHRGHNQIKLSL